jgi:hypothetical protein
MHVIAGFESQIAARGGAMAVIEAAREVGLVVRGVALARQDTEGAIHVDPIRGFELPGHVLHALDGLLAGNGASVGLRAGETVAVVALDSPVDSGATAVTRIAGLDTRGALWVTTD